MEVTTLLCDSSYCRLCGQENQKCSSLFELQENKQNLSDLVNRYLPFKVTDDRKFPTTICPGCIFQLEATKSFFELIIKGQVTLRDLYARQQETLKRQEKQRQQLENALKLVNPSSSIGTYTIQEDEVGEKILIQILSDGPLFSADHELALKGEGLEKPRRRRGRPPKPSVSGDNKENDNIKDDQEDETEIDGDGRRRRRIKVPTRFQEALQGKEMDRIFKEEGVIDDDSLSDADDPAAVENDKSANEIIGHMEDKDGEDLGELVVINKTTNKIKIRPKSSNASNGKRKRRFECDICCRAFSHAGRLEVHKSFHRNVYYMCGTEECGLQSDSKEAVLEHHRQSGHSGVTLLETLDFQISGEVNNTEVPLENTQVTIESLHNKVEEEAVEKPVIETTPEKDERITCKMCDKTFSCKQNYCVHVNAVHKRQKPYKCERCDKTFPYVSTYKYHMQQHKEKFFTCDICDKVFNHSSSLVYHKEAEHNNGRRFVCSKCKKTFKHKQLLLRHQLVHSNVRPHVCKYCDASFKTRANLLNHMPTHTGERKYYCNLCPNTFAHKTSLTFHMRWHNGSKPYECDVCRKTFSQKGNLAEHKRIHTGEKPFTCNQCDRKFTTSSQYKNHLKRHTGERPFQCEYCSKTFFHKDTWKSHTRRHSNERPFQCNQCMRAFTEQWALKKHQRLHTGEKPYVCEFCNKKFADSSNLAKHKKIHINKLSQAEKNGANIKIVTSEQGEKILYLTYDDGTNDDDEPQTVVHIMDSLDGMPSSVSQDADDISIMTADGMVDDGADELSLDASLQLQQVIDNDGNAVSITTEGGDVIKVVMSIQNGEQAIQGLLSDGTLVPIDLVMQDGKLMSAQLSEPSKEEPESYDTVDPAKDLPVPPMDSMLEGNIQFLAEDGQKMDNGIHFLSEDGQNLCFVTTYNSDDVVNSEYI